jgi:hypothetical protein
MTARGKLFYAPHILSQVSFKKLLDKLIDTTYDIVYYPGKAEKSRNILREQYGLD